MRSFLLAIAFVCLAPVSFAKNTSPSRGPASIPSPFAESDFRSQKNSLYEGIKKSVPGSEAFSHFSATNGLNSGDIEWTALACTDEPENGVYYCQLPLSLSNLQTSIKEQSLFFKVKDNGQLIDQSMKLACRGSNCLRKPRRN